MRYRNIRIILPLDSSPVSRRFAVELAHLVGFYSLNLVFPIVVSPAAPLEADTLYFEIGSATAGSYRRQGNHILVAPRDDTDAKVLWKRLYMEFAAQVRTENPHFVPRPDDYVSSSQQALVPVKVANQGGLEGLFELGWFLHDDDLDGIAERLDCGFVLPPHADYDQVSAACDLAARFGMETAGIRYPLVVEAANQGQGPTIEFLDGPSAIIQLNKVVGQGPAVSVLGKGRVLRDLMAQLVSQFPLVPDKRNMFDVTEHIESALRMQNYDGQAAEMADHAQKDATATVFMSADAPLERYRGLWPHATIRHFTEMKMVAAAEFSLPWEVEVAHDLLDTQVLPRVKRGDEVEFFALLSESKEIRDDFLHSFVQKIEARGGHISQASVLCAYKPGLSWLEESFAPAAAARGKVARMEIRFNPHLRPGAPVEREAESPWKKLDDYVEKPPRWLQELYPVDDLCASILGISSDDISFTAYTGVEDITYEALAFDESGKCLARDTLKVPVSEGPYFNSRPAIGVIAPTTGRFMCRVGMETIVDTIIPTDCERVWDKYQARALPLLEEYLLRKYRGNLAEAELPLFGRFELEISVSEPERVLPIRNDILSMGEVFAEDLLTATKAYIDAVVEENCGQKFDAVGLVLPRVHIKAGRPQLCIRLWDHEAEGPRVGDGGTAVLPDNTAAIEVQITQIEAATQGLALTFSIACPQSLAHRAHHLAQLTAAGQTELAYLLQGYSIKFLLGDVYEVIGVLPLQETCKSLSIDDIDLNISGLIGYDDWQRIAEQLRHVKGLDVYKAGTSYYGRTIYAVEPSCCLPGYTSNTKKVLLNPSLLLSARHHANEVSGSSAMVRLIRAMAKGDFRDLSGRVNLALIPMENPDGAALHYELQQEHPNWRHHASYTPPLGRDLCAMYFEEGLLNIDGQALTRIYQRLLPDVFIDLHGVPHHDWQSQFAPPKGYKGLWLPQALICAFYFYIYDDRYPLNPAINRTWAERVAEVYFEHPDLQRLNAMWEHKFAKYSYNGSSLLFPYARENKMLNYWIPGGCVSRHPYFSNRFPWLTTVSFTAETTDETAHGACLDVCAEAHLVHIKAGINICAHAGCVYEQEFVEEPAGWRAKYIRQRPILITESE